MTDFIHHGCVKADYAPEDSETEGQFDVIQENPRSFTVFDRHSGLSHFTDFPTLRDATRHAISMAAAYDNRKRRVAA